MNRSLNQHFFWVGLFIMLLSSCKEKEVTPVSDFTYASRDLKNYLSVYPVQEAIKFTNKSNNGVSYAWNFGDGSTSAEQEPIITYKRSGTYTITLTTTSSTGNQVTTTKAITIVDRVLKKITVQTLNWNAFGKLPDWEGAKRADLTIEIGQRTNGSSPIIMNTVLYRTDPLKNVINTVASFEVPVSQKVVLNPNVVNSNFLINVYGNDGNGNQLVYSTGGSGVGTAGYLSTTTQLYTITSNNQGTAIALECAYE